MYYKGVLIERNGYGYYTAWLDNAGRYCFADTLKACKEMIKEDLAKAIVCEY